MKKICIYKYIHMYTPHLEVSKVMGCSSRVIQVIRSRLGIETDLFAFSDQRHRPNQTKHLMVSYDIEMKSTQKSH